MIDETLIKSHRPGRMFIKIVHNIKFSDAKK
jgi:hypothetical protein